ncbi:MAG: tail assembly protein [Alphaproteobacteria bacterium]|nr:tail assembly protein [Alphaproteobacteria bacterium]
MSEQCRDIILSGQLAERYGRLHRLAVKTPAETIRALCANYPDFEKFVIESEKDNVGYRVMIGEDPINSAEELHYPAGLAPIHIVPVIGGAKGGFGQIFIGAALIGASFIPGLNVAVFAGAPGFLGTMTFASAAFGLGFSLVLGGVSQMLAPHPKAQAPSERPENKPSYAFDGPVNMTAQGQAVPIGYGELIVGSGVISQGFTADQYVE